MMGHTIAAHFRADPINRRELRAYAVDEVRRTNGRSASRQGTGSAAPVPGGCL